MNHIHVHKIQITTVDQVVILVRQSQSVREAADTFYGEGNDRASCGAFDHHLSIDVSGMRVH